MCLLPRSAPQNTDIEAFSSMEQTVMGVHVMQKEAAVPGDDPEDIGVLIEVVEVLRGLGNIAIACTLLFGLMYCLNHVKVHIVAVMHTSGWIICKLCFYDGPRIFCRFQCFITFVLWV